MTARETGAVEMKPVDMVLFCPKCGLQHVDAQTPDWTNPPHRSHLCHECGCVWRPADVPTNGVALIQTCGVADTVFYNRAALTRPQPTPSATGEIVAEACEPWEHSVGDPPEWGSPLLNVFDAGINYAAERMAETLGVTDYEWGDGTDDYASDVAMTFTNILKAAGFADADGDLQTLEQQAATIAERDARIEELREATTAVGSALDDWIRIVVVRNEINPDLRHYVWKRSPTYEEVQEAMRANNAARATLERTRGQ